MKLKLQSSNWKSLTQQTFIRFKLTIETFEKE